MKLRLALAPLVAAGCVHDSEIWIFYWDTPVIGQPTVSVSHNFQRASEIAAADATDPGWTHTSDASTSQGASLAQITYSSRDEALLVLDEVPWPGLREGDVWTFTYERFSDGSDSDSHISGYQYSHIWSDTFNGVITITRVKDVATGTTEATDGTNDNWREDDLWDPDIDIPSGQTPSHEYLEIRTGGRGGGKTTPATNARDVSDCNNPECWLTVVTQTVTTGSFNGALTGYDEESAYLYLSEVEQPAGY